ncbi:aldo/keto reductase [Altericroceibacterium endophyticum]|uniref:Aldo/keto reductase n=1 Tax=Altericroceibacterium endophyticum TaxID=1808508 RepID=A0A6I4T3U5_9SPHN|nr:aldo/keto reductase [Altericroceibacterium endophyticum]MXO64969.1 aldo/keto reductase [Altericroceibacterium endophyticum]
MTAYHPLLELNDGRSMPQLGYGTYQIDDDAVGQSIAHAIETGYRLVDTASFYENESGVGRALADRSDIWVTTKLVNDDQGREAARAALQASLEKLRRDAVDLYLIHWPCPAQDKYVESWQTLIDMKAEGLIKSIGVSNFLPEHLDRIVQETGVVPAVNQIELHPGFQQRDVQAANKALNIVTQSWSPLGQGGGMDNPTIAAIADETGQPASAVVLRWHIQHGLAPIPKSASAEHIKANFAALSFKLDDDQMERIDALDDPEGRLGLDPATFG